MADRLARAGFDIDLRGGEVGEGTIAALLRNPLVEVKTDHIAARTGNVFVEYRQPSGPSGISTSTAEWWVFYLPNVPCVIAVPRTRLMALVKQAHRAGLKKRGGDFNRYHGVLIPIEWLSRPWKAAA